MFQKLELTSFVIDGVPPTTEQIKAEKTRLERALLSTKWLLLAVYGAIGLASVGGLVFVGFRLGVAAWPFVIVFALVAGFALYAFWAADMGWWQLAVVMAASGAGGIAYVVVGELPIVFVVGLAAALMGALLRGVVVLLQERKVYVQEVLATLVIGDGCRNERTV